MADQVIDSNGVTQPGFVQVQSDAAASTERPAWLPEEFKTPEEFRAAYDAKLKPAFGDGDEATKPATEEVVDPNAPPKVEDKAKAAPPPEGQRTDEEIATSLKAAGGVYAHEAYLPAAIEFERTGKVSDETLATTAAAIGVPVEFAKEFVQLQQQNRTLLGSAGEVATAARVADIQSVAGGPEGYTALSAWVNANIPAAQVAAYNEALGSGNAEIAKGLLAPLVEAYKAAGNQSPRDITQASGTGAAAQPEPGYASKAEMQKDMNDPRYARDPAFNKAVMAKVGRTTAF